MDDYEVHITGRPIFDRAQAVALMTYLKRFFETDGGESNR